jgi:hypothetical protein
MKGQKQADSVVVKYGAYAEVGGQALFYSFGYEGYTQSKRKVNNAWSIGFSFLPPASKYGSGNNAVFMFPLALRMQRRFLCGGLGLTPAIYRSYEFVYTGSGGMGQHQLRLTFFLCLNWAFGFMIKRIIFHAACFLHPCWI